VIDDVDDLLGMEPDVQRMTDPPGVGCRPVELMMAPVVPGERANGLTPVDAETIESSP
jgi:hypothetical protein